MAIQTSANQRNVHRPTAPILEDPAKVTAAKPVREVRASGEAVCISVRSEPNGTQTRARSADALTERRCVHKSCVNRRNVSAIR